MNINNLNDKKSASITDRSGELRPDVLMPADLKSHVLKSENVKSGLQDPHDLQSGNLKTGNLKSGVLQLLTQEQGSPKSYSGQELAAHFGVTRAAVWKAIEALRKDGYPIEGRRNLGYRLIAEYDLVSEPLIRRHLTPEAAGFYQIECFESVSSTNTLLKASAANGAPAGTVLAAEMQTAGRGRMGRIFYSPKGSGIYLSLLLRPDLPAANAVQLTAAAAAAGALALEASFPGLADGSVKIKWVNDLFLDDHKICGILTEGMLSMESGKLDYAVVGIGFNLREPDGGWPEELKDIAGGLPDGITGSGARARLIAEFLNHFLALTKDLEAQHFLDEYRARQLVVGQNVEIIRSAYGTGAASGSDEKAANPTALAVGIDDDCCLIVRFADGHEEHLNSGEVRILPAPDRS